MDIIDFILNLAGLLLWLNWRSHHFDPLGKRPPATLMGTLRPASPKKLRPWHLLVVLVALLFLRAVIYWWIGSMTNWAGRLDWGIVVLACVSHPFFHMLLFSFFSFALTLGILFIALLFLSLLRGPDPVHRLIKIPLGRVDGWPGWVKFILPFALTALGWWGSSWLFAAQRIIPQPVSEAQRFQESVIIGLGSYLIWKIPAVIVLGLHLLNSYVYFGRHPFWNYINVLAQKILWPLKKIPLRAGKVDFAPVVGIAFIFFIAELAARGLVWFYKQRM